ncbi:MAG: hypothetical protein ABGW95_03725, partial [Candidatus Poseidoniia archaeon]
MLRFIAARLAADGHQVRVLTAQPSYTSTSSGQRMPRRETMDGFEVVRARLLPASKRNFLVRGINAVLFMFAILRQAEHGNPRLREVIEKTSPGSDINQKPIESLVEQAGGNPFFAMQLALLLARQDIQEQMSKTLQLPTLAKLVALRFDELSPNAMRLLNLAATAGGTSSNAVLRRASGLSPEDYAPALEELLGELLLCPTLEESDNAHASDESATYDLTHDKFRELAYERLSPEHRRALHLALAQALEEDPHGIHAEALLRHWEAVNDKERTRQYALQAASDAEDKLAFQRAAALYRAALRASEKLPWDEEVARWEKIGRLLEFAGEEQESIDAWRQAADLIRDRLKLISPRDKTR